MHQAHDPIGHLIAQWAYIRWADQRQLEAARTIADPAEYTRDRGISHGSVHALLLHMVQAPAVWMRTWGVPTLPETSAHACPDLPAVARAWSDVHDAMETFLRSLTPPDLDRPVHFERRGHQIQLPLGETTAHVIDHATYHRGQLNTLIKLAGGSPVWVSYWIYATRGRPQPSGADEKQFR